MPTELLINLLTEWGEPNIAGLAGLAIVFVTTGLIPVPRTALCLASGTLFGLSAIPIILPSTTIGGAVGFLLAKYLFAERVQRIVSRRTKLRAILRAVDDEGWRIVALMRFAGPLPTSVQNYLFGLTQIGFIPFTIATLVFTAPQVCLYVYLGALGKAALLNEPGSFLRLALASIAAVTLLTIVAIITRKARAALSQLASRDPCSAPVASA